MEVETATPVVAPVDDVGSLADHAAQFAPGAERVAPVESEPTAGTATAPPAAEAEPGATGARDDQGRFVKAPRHRAKSQQAGADDVPRIAELTKRLREVEAERDTLRSAPAEQPIQARPAPVASPPMPVQVQSTAKPQLKTFVEALKGDEDYSVAVERYGDALTDWKLDQRDATRAHQEQERAKFSGFESKVNAAKAKYPDFQAVALDADSRIPQGSLIDRYVWEHKAGADLLYHFQTHPDEIARVLGLPVLDQIDALALLAHQLTTPAVAAPKPAPPVVASRPPTLVKTGPVAAANEAPGDDDMSIDNHAKYYGPKAVRR